MADKPDKDAELTRYKKLLVKAKGAIDAQKSKAEAKGKEIETLRASLESAQARLRTDQDAAEPSRVLRVVQGTAASGGAIWCLVEYVDENLDPSWRRFGSSEELSDYIRKDAGEPLELPAPSLSPAQTEELKAAGAAELEAVREEYRRYRVRAEIMKKQQKEEVRKATEARDLSAMQAAAAGAGGSGSAAGGGGAGVKLSGSGAAVMAELEDTRAQLRRLQPLEREAAEERRRSTARIAQLETAVAEARSGAGEAALAAQWRERYEAAAAERDGAKKRGEQLESDYAKYRAKAMAVLEEKEKLLGEGGDGGARRSGGGTGGRHGRRHGGNGAAGDAALSLQQVAYLKNIVLQYMSEPAVREHMEGAISTVLQFTPAEVARVQKARPLKAGWAGAALSMMGAGKR